MKNRQPSISDIRVAWGVRKIGPSSVANTGKTSFKWGAQDTESGLESDYLKVLAFDPDVVNVQTQPFTLYWPNGKGSERHYTPDVLIEYRQNRNDPSRGKSFVTEIKPSAVYEKKKEELDPKFEIARIWCAHEGYDFRLITEKDFSGDQVWNAQFLMRYQNVEFMLGTTEAKARIDQLRAAVSTLGKTTPIALLSAVTDRKGEWAHLLPQIWHLICSREIHTDFLTRISMHSPIWAPHVTATGSNS